MVIGWKERESEGEKKIYMWKMDVQREKNTKWKKERKLVKESKEN